jgi:hypothetical protein
MAADRRIDTTKGLRKFRKQRLVERFAHAVEPLEFESVDAAGILDDAGNGQGVVRGELRKQPVARRQEPLHAGHVTKVGHRLAGEDRIIRQAALLGAFDFGIPIGALDQSHGQLAVCGCGHFLDPIDQRQSALLIGLHREAEAIPAAERAIAECRGDHLKGQFQPIGLFRVNGELQIVRLGQFREFNEPRRQFLAHTLARDRLVAWVQRRKLDGNSRSAAPILVAAIGADSGNGAGISFEIVLRVGAGARAFAEHIERIAQLRMRIRARKRLFNRPPHDEVRSQ